MQQFCDIQSTTWLRSQLHHTTPLLALAQQFQFFEHKFNNLFPDAAQNSFFLYPSTVAQSNIYLNRKKITIISFIIHEISTLTKLNHPTHRGSQVELTTLPGLHKEILDLPHPLIPLFYTRNK